MERVSGVKELLSHYDGFILDQYGVLHDGSKALPGAAACVRMLQEAGKHMVLLSNSSQRAQNTLAKAVILGFEGSPFKAAVTSGEECHRYVLEHLRGSKCVLLGFSNRTDGFLEDLNLTYYSPVAPSEASFVFLFGTQTIVHSDGSVSDTSSFNDSGDLSLFDPILQSCAEHQLPMVCANPDLISISASGGVNHVQGSIAEHYEKTFGGTVRYFGKPFVSHFNKCVETLGLFGVPRDRIVHVGDSLKHDIAGANNANIDSIFITSGVHGTEIASLSTPGQLHSFCVSHKATPRWVMDAFNQ